MHSSKLRELNNIVHLTWQKRGGGVRSGERGRECVKEAAGRAALKGGEGELEGVEGGSATLEGGEEAAARGVGGIKFPQCRPYFISILGIVIFCNI